MQNTNLSDLQKVNSEYYYDGNTTPMELKDWIFTLLLMLIPFVNIILVFVWAFGHNVNRSKKTYFQAILALYGVVFAFFLIISLFFR